MNAAAIGTLAWADRTRGALSRQDQLQLAATSVRAQLAALPAGIRRRLSSRAMREAMVFTPRAVPDSAPIRAALSLAERAYTPALLNHCLRCWMWADLFARIDGSDFDDEVLYLACVLHDLALTDPHRPPRSGPHRCFAVHGAAVAADLLDAWEFDVARHQGVAEAIVAHMNPVIPPGLGPEARLLHAGAHLDVAGTRCDEVPDHYTRDVLTQHPRLGFGDEFCRLMRRESVERPQSRAALFWRLGMKVFIATNPLERRG
jgi:hypothetical protein